MKMLFKLYLLGQLIALPFMVGAIGGALGGGTEPSSASDSSRTESVIDISALDAIASQQTQSDQDLCDTLHSGESLGILDNYQQLTLVTDAVDGEDYAIDCYDQRSP